MESPHRLPTSGCRRLTMTYIDLTLRRLIHASARHLDNRDYAGFVDLFAPNGEYRVDAKAPELTDTMTWMEMTRDELAERCKQLGRQEWEITSYEQTRLLSIDIVDVDTDTAHTSTGFVIYHTDTDGATQCYAAGRYEDDWHRSSDDWFLTARRVDLKTRLLSPMSPLPL